MRITAAGSRTTMADLRQRVASTNGNVRRLKGLIRSMDSPRVRRAARAQPMRAFRDYIRRQVEGARKGRFDYLA